MSEFRSGADGEPLPGGIRVIRTCKKAHLSKEGRITELQFKPSSEDMKDEPHHRLSVFAENLTPDEHVYRLTNTTAEEAILPRLEVDRIRAIRPDPIAPNIPALEVEWHYKYDIGPDGARNRNTSPGADGHSGIRDLTQGDKKQRKSLRVQLATMAQADYEQGKAASSI